MVWWIIVMKSPGFGDFDKTYPRLIRISFNALFRFNVWISANICIVEGCQMSSYYGPLPEPDTGQPYNKYHWVKSAMEKLQNGCPKGAQIHEGRPIWKGGSVTGIDCLFLVVHFTSSICQFMTYRRLWLASTTYIMCAAVKLSIDSNNNAAIIFTRR